MNAIVSSHPFSTRSHQDLIAQRAREMWHARGCPQGQDLTIWLDAEHDLIRRRLLPASYAATSTSAPRAAAPHLDTGKVVEQLNDFGQPNSRSATSLDLTRST